MPKEKKSESKPGMEGSFEDRLKRVEEIAASFK